MAHKVSAACRLAPWLLAAASLTAAGAAFTISMYNRLYTYHAHSLNEFMENNEVPHFVRELATNAEYCYEPIQLDGIEKNRRRGHVLYETLHRANGIQEAFMFMRKSTHRRLMSVIGEQKIDEAEFDGNDTAIVAVYKLGNSMNGHPGIIHGGTIATLIDDCAGHCAIATLGAAFTAKLVVDYLKPIPENSWIRVESKPESIESRKAWVVTEISNGNDVVYARGRALFVRPRAGFEEHKKKHLIATT